jgi:Protein of unknown function (DUF1549)/Protein of unknown function (DUF1553)
LKFHLLLLLLVSASLTAAGDFRTDVMAVLSKAGCNAGACHGNATGKGGFKLSLRGQDAGDDWLALAREQGGRRVNAIEPEQSLILLKATAAIAHEGGQRFARGSPEYSLLLEWLGDGARDTGAERRLVALEVTPREFTIVEPGKSVTIHATARFSDGTERDVTRLAVFEPNNTHMTATAEGSVTCDTTGETTVLVRFLGRQEAVRLAFVPAREGFAWSGPEPVNFVDTHVFEKLRALRMNPSPVCDDTTFLRRAYLDLLGVVPTAETARTFTADPTRDKRARLVDALLARGEFADFWALKWADLLKIEERQLDKKGMAVFHGWIRESIAKGKPLDQFARELIAARGSTYENPPANWWRANRDTITRAENTARVFLGTQVNCAQCHNHPFERWTQDDYYDWAGLFARVDYKIVENKRKDTNDTREFKGDQLVQLKPAANFLNARTRQPAAMRFLGAGRPEVSTARDELLALADWLPRSPMFARTQVNRIWSHLLGRGLVDPVDDFRASNPPSHPALLDALADDLAKNGFDLRRTIRVIMASRTYQLASSPDETNADDEANHSRGIVRRLGAEQLLDSMSKALSAPVTIEAWPDATRLAQVPEGRKHYHPIRTDLDRFALDFGKPPRLIASDTERTSEPAMPQAFQLLGGPTVNELITRKGNALDTLLDAESSDSERIEQLYWRLLSRPPAEPERAAFSTHLASAKDRRRALEDLTWALLNSKEFLFRR